MVNLKTKAFMEDKTILGIVAIIALLILECWALELKIDGVVFSLVVAIIAGIAGYKIGPLVKPQKK